jgi:tetratricopeptide (TPR) repeat protein
VTLLWQQQLKEAIHLWQSGRPSDACDLLADAEQDAELSSKFRAQLKMERAYFLGLSAHFRDAKVLFDEAETLLEQSGSLDAIGDLQWRQGLVLHFFGDFNASDRCFRTALESGEKDRNIGVVALASAGIGKNLMMSGHPDEAVPWFERALTIFEDRGWQLHMSAIYSELGVCYFGLENLAKSLELLLKAEQIDRETGSRTGLQIVLANIGNVYPAAR